MFVELDDEGYDTILKLKNNPNTAVSKGKEYQFLYDKRFIVNSNREEENKLVLSSLTSRYNPHSMSLTIAPTLLCNFNCPYCYENHKHNKRMNSDVQKGIVEFVKRNGTIKQLNVIWYGGEPTMEIPVITNLSKELRSSVDHYSAFMVTNGYRIDKLADEFSTL